jgi:hypothetical protein
MTKDVEHFFVYLLAICTSFMNCLFDSFVHLLIELFVLLVFWVFLSSFFFSDGNWCRNSAPLLEP